LGVRGGGREYWTIAPDLLFFSLFIEEPSRSLPRQIGKKKVTFITQSLLFSSSSPLLLFLPLLLLFSSSSSSSSSSVSISLKRFSGFEAFLFETHEDSLSLIYGCLFEM